MKITLVRAMTRSAVFELLNDSCYRAPAPYTVQLNGETVLDGDTNVFSLFSLQPGIYLETSGSTLFAYAVLKGVWLGYLPKRYAAYGEKAFYGTCDKHLGKGADGTLQLGGICLVAGLGGATRRDGSLEYYFSEPVVENDAKGVDPLLLAYTEILTAKA